MNPENEFNTIPSIIFCSSTTPHDDEEILKRIKQAWLDLYAIFFYHFPGEVCIFYQNGDDYV